jgi:hypothetical protein
LTGRRVPCSACGHFLDIPTSENNVLSHDLSWSDSGTPSRIADVMNEDPFWQQELPTSLVAPTTATLPPVKPAAVRLRFSQRMSSLVDCLPGGLTLWLILILCGLFPVGIFAASSERTLIMFGILCGVFALVCWAYGIVWVSAVIVEKRGWLFLIITLVTFGRLGYMGDHWDECGRPVCLSILGPVSFGCLFLVPMCLYALMNP